MTTTSNLGGNITTTDRQTYQGEVTITGDRILTTTNSNVIFNLSVNAGTLGDSLTIAAGSGDVTFHNAVGGSTALGDIDITTGALTAGAIKAQGTLTITNSDTSNITGVISEQAVLALVKEGSGSLTLSGINTYTGSTTLTTGSIKVASSANLGATPVAADADNIIFNGGTLITTATFTLGTNKGITMTGAGTINTSTGTLSYGGVITGSSNLTKSGSGTLILSGDNGHTGDLNITVGTVTVIGTLSNSTDVTVSSGAVYDVDQTDTIQSLSGAGTINIANSKTLNFGDAFNQTIDGVIEGSGSIIKTGTGRVTLGGTNTYTGNTTITNGVLTVNSAGKLGNGNYSGTLTVAASTIFNFYSSSDQTFSNWETGSGTINLSGGGTVTLIGDQNFTGTLNVSQMLVMYNGTSGTDTGLGKATTIDIKNGGTIKVQQGTDTDASNNAFIGAQRSGGPDIYIRTGGELTTDDSNGQRAYHIGANLILDGGTLSWEQASGNYSIRAAYGTWILNQNVAVTDDSVISAPAIVVCNNNCASTTVFTVESEKTLTVSGYFYNSDNFTETAIEKAGAGTMILQAASTITTGITVSAGTLAVTANNALGTNATGTTITSGAILDLQNVNYSTTEAIINNGGTIATSTGTSSFAGAITLGADSIFNVDGTQLTVSGVIQDGVGTYGITKNGNGKLILSGANTYDGTTAIADGSLRASHNTALGATTGNTTVAAFAALELIDGITIASGEDLTLIGIGEDITGALRNISGDNIYNGNISLSNSPCKN